MDTSAPLQPEDFMNEVRGIVYDLKALRHREPERFHVSDLFLPDPEDPEHRLQFVDLVQEGGGILGIALVGYTYVLEELGIRFASLGGTSAGSINTVLMAALGKPQDRKSEKILRILANKDFREFMDGGRDVHALVGGLASSNRLRKWIGGIFAAIGNLDEVLFEDGLNPGTSFDQWLEGILSGAGVDTVSKLLAQMNDFPEPVKKQLAGGKRAHLAIIAADITTETKVQFPKMSPLYFADPDHTHPARFVRASMSIPIFFSPVRIDLTILPRHSTAYTDQWSDPAVGACYNGPIPEEVLLVDGGIMSNFPIDVFHNKNAIPTRPTFGVRLGLDRTAYNRIDSMLDIINACFEGAKNIRDAETIQNSGDFQELIGSIDVGDHNWLNFGISNEHKLDLFRRGAMAASTFLQRFDWEKYKQIRRKQILLQGQEGIREVFARKSVLWRFGIQEDDHVLAGLTQIERTGRRPLMLWIDDEPANDFIELQSLQSLGVDYQTATSTNDARRWLAQQTFDCIVTDSRRDGDPEEGLNFCRELLRTYPRVPVILRSMSVHHRSEEITDQFPNVIAQTGEIQEVIRVIFRRLFPANHASTAPPEAETSPPHSSGTNF